jgi:ERCC4-related helicase
MAQKIGFDPDGFYVGGATTDKVGFYGYTPIVQRSSSNQATSNIAVSASFGATQLAVIQEIMNTLIALGIYKGSA